MRLLFHLCALALSPECLLQQCARQRPVRTTRTTFLPVRASETPAHSSHVSTGGHNATVRLICVDKDSARGDVGVRSDEQVGERLRVWLVCRTP